MVKIWAKILKKDKIIKSYVYEKDGTMDYSEFFNIVSEICYKLDVPTPVIIKHHIFNYAKYNFVTFKQADFVEQFSYDKLVLENIEGK